VGELPLEGSNVWATFKYISKGKIYRISSLVQFHINANGDLTGEVNKYYEDCN